MEAYKKTGRTNIKLIKAPDAKEDKTVSDRTLPEELLKPTSASLVQS